MNNIRLTKSQKVLLYLVKELGRLVEGRKKLMKLLFLMEHYDTEKEKLKKNQFLGNSFIIYHYGVFSFDVMNDYISLNNRGIMTEYPIKTDIKTRLDEETKSRIDGIIHKFGNKHGFELEEETLRMLGLSKESKIKFFGKDVKEIIRDP